MSWRKAFGSQYEVPASIESAVKDGITTDLSWHKDTAPSFGFVNDNYDIRLWVEHPNPSKREFGPDAKRYGVTVVSGGGVERGSESFDHSIPAKEFYRKMLVKYLSPKDIRKVVESWSRQKIDSVYLEIVGYEPTKDDSRITTEELRDLVSGAIWLEIGGPEGAL